MELKSLDNIPLHFIVGIGRGGSTLLVTLLNEYPDCIATPEIHHFIFFYKKYRHVSFVTEELQADYKSYIDAFFKHKNNPLIGPPDNTLLEALKPGEPITYSQLTKLIYLGLYGNKGIRGPIRVIVDKNPFYMLQIDKLTKVFPNARFIGLIRDYRGFTLSYMQSSKPGAARKSIFYYLYAWNLCVSELLKAQQTLGNRLKVVCYEDMALKKEEVVKEIFEFLGLPNDPAIFNFHDAMQAKLNRIHPSDKNYARMQKKITDLSSPIHAGRVYAWKESLSPKNQMICDLFSGQLGKQFGYTSTTHAGIGNRLFYRLLSFPAWIKVLVFKWMRSPELHFYYKYSQK